MNQYKFIYNENGDLLVDFVGRFEDFHREVESILEKINYQTHFWGIRYRSIPHKYKGERRHYSEYYDDESREMLGEIYQEDIKHFGYEF
ncbi:MAG: sulfotransferase family 2 domain-containing protein [Bacteroidota bacterium]